MSTGKGMRACDRRVDREPELEKKKKNSLKPTMVHWKEAYSPQTLGIENSDPLVNKELRSILQKKSFRKLPCSGFRFNFETLWMSWPREMICKE